LWVLAINNMVSLKATCRSAFEDAQANPSASQQQISKTLRDMRMSVEDEVQCPKSGYSIDMLVHAHDSTLETGGESSSGRVWAVEFDGPSHFLASGTPTGATLLTASGAAGTLSLQHALLGVDRLQGRRREGAVSEEQAG
jgi:hypothetical protein